MKRFFSIIAVVSLLVFMFPQTALAKNNTDLNSQVQIVGEYTYSIFDYFSDLNYIVVVQNNSQSALTIDAKGYGLDSSGTIVEVDEDTIYCLGPGKQAVLDFWLENDDNNEVAFTTQLNVSKADYIKDYSNYISYLTTTTSNSAIVTLTNTGNREADVKTQAIFFSGANIVYFDYDYELDMSPGQSMAVQLDSGDRAFDNCLVFVQADYYSF